MDQSVNSEKIKQLRIARSWSQEKLSLASGLSLRTIQRIENEGVCSLDSRQAIAATLQVDSSDLGSHAANSSFNNQNLSESKYDDINFSSVEFTNSNMLKAKFANLNMHKARFVNNVEINDANISGMKIFGYLVTDLVENYEKTQKKS